MKKLYFAYGSNLNSHDWGAWCQAKGHDSSRLVFRSCAYLPDHELRFTVDSSSRNGGVLDVVDRRGQLVQGALFDVSDEGWRALEEKEGSKYEKHSVIVLTEDGAQVPAITFRVKASFRRNFVAPGREYARVVSDGMEQHGIEQETMLLAARNQSCPLLVDAFFVYGTLLRGECRHSILRRYGVECVLLSRAFGRLVDLGSFPGLIEPWSRDAMVEGEFVRLGDPAGAVVDLDQVEGFRGFGRDGSLYQRALINVDVGNGRIRRAWTYVYAGNESGPVIESGAWRGRYDADDAFLAKLVQTHAGQDPLGLAERVAQRGSFPLRSKIAKGFDRPLDLIVSMLRREIISERDLAKASGNWAAIP